MDQSFPAICTPSSARSLCCVSMKSMFKVRLFTCERLLNLFGFVLDIFQVVTDIND
jgi:hypothetical protein